MKAVLMNYINLYMGIVLAAYCSSGDLFASGDKDSKLLKIYTLSIDQSEGLQGTSTPRSQKKIESMIAGTKLCPIIDSIPIITLPKNDDWVFAIEESLAYTDCGQYWLQDEFFTRAQPFVTQYKSLGEIMQQIINADIALQENKHRFFSPDSIPKNNKNKNSLWLQYLYKCKDKVYKDCESKKLSVPYLAWPYIKEIHNVRNIVDSSWDIPSSQKDF